jgi:hypothetical protein
MALLTNTAMAQIATPKLTIDKVWFEPGSAELASTNEQLLDVIASQLNANLQLEKIAIEGFAARSGDGTDELVRWNLSIKRSHAVAEALIARGVAAERLIIFGYGSEHERHQDRKLDRRAQLTVLRIGDRAVAAMPVADAPFPTTESTEIVRNRASVNVLGINAAAITKPLKLAVPRAPIVAPAPELVMSLGTSQPASPHPTPSMTGAAFNLSLINNGTCRIDANYAKQIATTLR